MSEKQLLGTMKAIIGHINQTNPGLGDIERFIDRHECAAIRRNAVQYKVWDGGGGDVTPSPSSPPGHS